MRQSRLPMVAFWTQTCDKYWFFKDAAFDVAETDTT
jgi:hypothetical protein